MKILITGGSGLIGRALAERLLKEGHHVNILTRKLTSNSNAKEYVWNEYSVDKKAFENVEVLVHLAGAGIADQRWTRKRKSELVDSRVKTLQLLQANYAGDSLHTIIGGSAIGYYGGDSGETENNEYTPNGSDFMADCCLKWENAEEEFAKNLKLRLVKIRTGVVLDTKAGALPKLLTPIRYNAGMALGNGEQWMSWIHIDDIVEMFYQAIVNPKINGILNGVASNPVRNQDFTKIASKVLKKKYFLPNVPAFLLKIALGEMSVVVLGSSKVKNKQELPFKLKFNVLQDALLNLLSERKDA